MSDEAWFIIAVVIIVLGLLFIGQRWPDAIRMSENEDDELEENVDARIVDVHKWLDTQRGDSRYE